MAHIKEVAMFTAKDILARVRQQPFMPLRLVTSSGQSYDVTHPDLIWVGHRDLMVGVGSNDAPTFYDQVSRVAIMHVTALQVLPTRPKPGVNGPA
jgi:hypothetical protein